jgi:hypothetical protein
MPVKSPTKPEFEPVFARLKGILQSYETSTLKGHTNEAGNYTLLGPATPANRDREFWFGEVRKGKAYVSYHLMAVYTCPDLLVGMSPALKKHMQGKSCFNFKSVDESLFKELAGLTKKGRQRLKKAKLI